jgi:hypothetical protein
VLVSDYNGVRTFIVYRYGEQEKDDLLKIAESMLVSQARLQRFERESKGDPSTEGSPLAMRPLVR